MHTQSCRCTCTTCSCTLMDAHVHVHVQLYVTSCTTSIPPHVHVHCTYHYIAGNESSSAPPDVTLPTNNTTGNTTTSKELWIGMCVYRRYLWLKLMEMWTLETRFPIVQCLMQHITVILSMCIPAW